MAKLSTRELTDEELEALDPYAPDPGYRVGLRHHSKEKPVILSQCPADHLRAAAREDFWLIAAAFGQAPVSQEGGPEVTYMDALRTFAAHHKQDRRRGNNARAKTTGDTMRRKFGREA